MNPNEQALNWWQSGVIYQIYPRSFLDTTGNGIGDLSGIIDKLDYLNDGTDGSLGVDAIWISPFYPSPMADFGYDVADYCNVDPLFGDLEIFDRLVIESHRRGIKLIIDYVPNHTSDRHPWFLESRSSRENSKRDWYIWRDPAPDGTPINNWGSAFGGPAWTWDETTHQFYLHQFLKEQPELNWRNPEVRTAMLDVLRFWLDRGVDGFRMDVIGMIIKDRDLRDNPPNPRADPNLHPDDIFSRQLHVYNEGQDEVHSVLKDMRRLLDQYEGRCAIGELWYEPHRWVRYYGENSDELHLPFNFDLIHQPWQAADIRKSVDGLEAILPSFGWPNYVLGSHDAPRLASRIGLEQIRVAAMLLLTLRGTPTLYYGDEIGIENGQIPPERMQDPQGRWFGPERNRDVSRTPMQWESSQYAGFSVKEPWLPISADYKQRNVAHQAADKTSILSLYKKLIHLRKRTPALQRGDYIALDIDKDGVYAYLRATSSAKYLIALNFLDKIREFPILGFSAGEIVISTYLDRTEPIKHKLLSLRPNEGVIIKIKT